MPYDFPTVQANLSSMVLHSPVFRLIPANMAELTLPVNLQWKQKPFTKENVTRIVEQPGVYAFGVAHARDGLPPHGYILYIGQVGARSGRARTLRARFREYLREKSRGKRPRIAYFLKTWETCLVFHFAALDPAAVDLLDVERRLNDAMIPPFSQADFSPGIRQMKRLAESLVQPGGDYDS